MADRAFKAIVAGTIAFGIGAIAWAEYAEAQTAPQLKCGPTNDILRELRKSEQTEVAVGAINPQTLFMFLASPGGAEWTQVSIRVDGTTCILARGKHWSAAPITPEGRPA